MPYAAADIADNIYAAFDAAADAAIDYASSMMLRFSPIFSLMPLADMSVSLPFSRRLLIYAGYIAAAAIAQDIERWRCYRENRGYERAIL